MKKNLFFIMKNLLIAGVVLFLCNSCTKEYTYYIDPEGEFARVDTQIEKIYIEDWKWVNNRFQAFIPLELYEGDYDWASISVNLFRWENEVERLTALPYIRTYYDDFDNTYTYTETFSYEIVDTNNQRGIYFYLQASDLADVDYAVREDYDVKIAITYNFTY